MRIYSDEIRRFTVGERLVHWIVSLAFVYLMLTGLALFTPHLYWLASVFGGGTTIRAWHPIVGVVFFVFLARMFFMWRRSMPLDALDREWLKESGRYARNEDAGLPEPGRFNAGQKLLFWLQVVAGVLLFVSGIPLWFPETFGRNLRLLCILVHEISALAVIGGIIVHIYMGTAVVRGSLHAMMTGYVSRAWAKAHHPRWYREITGGR